MINAEIVPLQNDTFLVRFSDPDENFAQKPFTPALSKFDIERRLDFLNRKYIVEKLISWLNQRLHARKDHEQEIFTLSTWLDGLKKTNLRNVCLFVSRKRESFEIIAPIESSSCFAYYKRTIVPILDFCTAENKAVSDHE